MKTFSFYLLFFSILISGCADKDILPAENNPSTNHFEFILYDGLKESVTPAILTKLEENYQRILDDLTVTDISKVKVKIWNNEQNYLDVMENDIGQRYPGTTGYVYGPAEIRILYTSNAPQTAHHEFAHVVSLNLKNNFANNPRWLWEAVAIYESGEFRAPNTVSYLAAGNYPSLAELSSDPNNSRKIYDVGYTLSEYIISTWGKEKFIAIIVSNGNFPSILNISPRDFETGWQNFVKDKYF